MPHITNLATNAAQNTKANETENEIPDTTSFTPTPEFKRLTKMNSDAKMETAAKSLTSTSQVDNVLDIADKKREKNTKISEALFKLFHW